MRSAALVLLLVASTACDVGSVLPEGGLAPDASGGGTGTGTGTGSGSGSGSGSGTPTAGTMRVTFTTTESGGPYRPQHVLAVWLEGADGTYLRTIQRYSDVRTVALVAWNQKSIGNADAMTGATRNAHGELSATWDLTNAQSTVVPDGTYTIRMELSDENATTAGQNNQGTFTFTKGTAPEMQTGLSNGGFTNVSIVYTP